MRQVKCLPILFLSIALVASYVCAGGGQGGHGSSRPGPSSYRGGEGGGGKYSGYSNPSDGYKGYGGKLSGYSAPSSGSKSSGGKSQQGNKGDKDSAGEDLSGRYGQGTPSEECRLFLDEMSGSRKEFAGKRSAYFEARENPKSNPEYLALQQQVVHEILRAIEEKNNQNCRWIY